MGAPTQPLERELPQPSALQSLLSNHKSTPSHTEPHLNHLALQIAHNLRYQHNWTEIRIHYSSPGSSKRLPRPLLSGIPPKRLYVHPDEQIELLQKQKNEGKTGLPELMSEREWVLPSHLRERWTLRRFGEVFDAISKAPESDDGDAVFAEERRSSAGDGADSETDVDDASEAKEESVETGVETWRERLPKRLLLATLDDDSTIVYYIVHDGIVKPRQN